MSAINASTNSVRASIEVMLDPATAFAVYCEELAGGLATVGIHFEPTIDGRVVEGATGVGRVVEWEQDKRLTIQWHPANWQPDLVTRVELRVEPLEGATRVILEHRGWGSVIGDAHEFAGWFARQVAAPLLLATGPAAYGDWFTDRRARRPSGTDSRNRYRDPLYHYPSFKVILNELALTAADYLLDVGCGGGAFLKSALRSGCRAAGVDHSPEMVQVAIEENRDAIAHGYLTVVEATADRLPFAAETFTSATMHGVLGFLPDAVAALRETYRVLSAGGRLALFGTDPELKGTPACPEPMASRLQFYDDDALLQIGRASGFESLRVLRQNLAGYAREVGVPEEHLALFSGHDARFLLARKR